MMQGGFRPGPLQVENGCTTKYKAGRVLTTPSINIPMIQFLPPQEQLSFQLANRFCYNILVSSIQFKVQINEMIYFTRKYSEN